MEQQPPVTPLLASPPARTTDSPLSPHRPRKRHAWVWVVLLLAFAAIFVAVLRYKPAPVAGAQAGGRRGGAGQLVTINTATAGAGQIGVYLDAIGTVTATYTATITAR